MNSRFILLFCLLLFCLIFPVLISPGKSFSNEEQQYGIETRTLWTSSRVVGSPDPPLPYVTVKEFSNIEWSRPIYAKQEPDTNYLIVVLQGGEKNQPSKLLRIEDLSNTNKTSLFLEMPRRLVYGLEFHPKYESNGFVYIFSNGPTGNPERKNRISRFSVSRDSESKLACDPKSETTIIEWRSMGHDGGDLVFGHDQMLYATSGDGTSDSDIWLSAQDVSNLRGGVIRIDVDKPEGNRPYSIPKDNPFTKLNNARAELWAIGLRNPWRMSVDRKTGQIWIGNNGQDLWETVHLLGRGENYGWSVYEGSHAFYTHRELGPGSLTNPTFEHHHREARSLTGGVVYYGEKLPELNGAYIYGDYSTGKIWSGRHDGTEVVSHKEIADTPLQIAGFSNTHRGELLIIDLGGGIHRLEPNAQIGNQDSYANFPKKLSDTGLFDSVREHRVAAGVIPYSVNAPAWNDGASAQRFIAVPDNGKIGYTQSRGWNFSDGAVLVQTLSINEVHQNSIYNRRIETRLLTKQNNEWAGYSYKWNASQDEAILVDRDGEDITLNATTNGATKEQRWRIPSRAECMSCHSRAVNFVLGMTELQMNKSHNYANADGNVADGNVIDNQIRTLEHIGLLSSPPKPIKELTKLANPHDESFDIESRAKSYLHVNCSGCHVEAGGGNARIKLEFTTSVDKMKVVSQYPQHETFNIAQPQIVAPADPNRSVLYHRVNRRGRGQMPPLVSTKIDQKGSRLIKSWIESLESDRKFVKAWSTADIIRHLPTLASDRSFEKGRQLFQSVGCAQCHKLKNTGGGVGPDLTGISSRMKFREIIDSIVSPSSQIAEKYATTIVITTEGKTIQGRIEKDDDTSIVLRDSNSFSKPQTILKDDIEERFLSKTSTMPIGTINHLKVDEILELLAYLLADGNSEHASYAH